MNTADKKATEEKTSEARIEAASEAKSNTGENKVLHTVNPFTGTEVKITPEDLEGVKKKMEADTERD